MSKARDIADLGSNDVLETTATGVDVTGTVQADGLDLPNGGFLNSARNSGSLSLPILGHPSGSDTVRYLSSDGHSFVNGSLTKALQIANNGNVSFYEDTGTTAKMVWDSSAESLNLGGTATTNTAGFSQNLALKDLYPSITFEDTGSGTAKYTIGATSGALGVWDSSVSAYRMFIDSSGNVGIGTASPHNEANYKTLEIAAGFGGSLRLTNGASVAYEMKAQGALLHFGSETNHPIMFKTNDTERARIDSSGNFRVGNTTTEESTVGGRMLADGRIHAITSAGACFTARRMTSNGTVARFLNTIGSQVGSIVTTSTTTAYNQNSDYRLKENVTSMDNASDRVLALNPCRFNFIQDPDTTVDGFLAHEAQEVVPEAVTGSKDAMRTEEYEVTPAVEATYDEDGNELTPAVEAVMGTREVPDYQGIDQSKLVPLLTKALQEALTEIDNLKLRIETLENKQ